MTLRAALLELRGRAKDLQARLQALAESAEEAGGGTVHHLVEQVDKSAVDALGWVKAARKAIRKTVRRGVTSDDVRDDLAEAQVTLNRLRRGEPRRLRGRALLSDLADLSGRGEEAKNGLMRLAAWSREAIPLLKAVQVARRAVDETMAACWRLLSSDSPGSVRIENLMIADKITTRRKR